jgi:hypothetical protein
MPHFGLMDENAMGPVEGPLMRAKLHIRCGRERLHQGKVSLGILTLYDALISAMEWYIANPAHKSNFRFNEGEDAKDDRIVFGILVRSGVLDDSFDYNAFSDLADKALNQDLSSYDYTEMLKGVESVMTRLGVMPFDESELPPPDPKSI